MPHSVISTHWKHIINEIIWPFPTPHPYPYFPIYVKGHASMRKNTATNRHAARRDDVNIRDTLRQGEMVQTPGMWHSKWRTGKGESRWLKDEGDKRTDTYPDLRYLATGLWTYIISTGLPTGLPKWITVGWGLWSIRLEHKKITLFFFLFHNWKHKAAGHTFMHTNNRLF